MAQVIARLLQPLLRLFIPVRVHHDVTDDAAVREGAATTIVRPPNDQLSVLRGEDVALVRPYVLAHEAYERRELQRQRRRAVWLALHGFDAGPEWIHGVRVRAS